MLKTPGNPQARVQDPMKLYYWKSPHGNVGDDLNPWLWPKVFGDGFFDTTAPNTFFGIGSILDNRTNTGSKAHPNVIFGPGLRKARNFQPAVEKLDIRFVRGPLSAAALSAAGLPGVRYISDPAILTPRFSEKRSATVPKKIGFIPYYNTPADLTNWIARETGMEIVPITTDVDDFVARLTTCDYVVTEAMHGAILSDAFRIPWAACRLLSGVSEGRTSLFKWQDWSNSLGFSCQHLSSLPDTLLWLPGKLRAHLRDFAARRSLKTVQAVLKRADWSLSDDNRLREAQDAILHEAERLKADYQH